MGTLNFLFYLFIYIPLNVIFMLLAALLLSVLNKLLQLHFPSWSIAMAAALLVFVVMALILEGSSSARNDGGLFYSTTIFINSITMILMLTMSWFNKLIFKSGAAVSFTFEKPQVIAAMIYAAILIGFAMIPVTIRGKEYLSDANDEKYKRSLKEIIDNNNNKAFEKALEKNYQLSTVRLSNYSTQSLFEYVLLQDKPQLAAILIKHDKELITYNMDWEIKSTEMLDALVQKGMPPIEAVEKLTGKNNTRLVKTVIEKYHPSFDEGNDMMVKYITLNLLNNNNLSLLDYLVENGLAKDTARCSNALCYYIEKNDLSTVKMLMDKGFSIDTTQHIMIEKAIVNENVEMLDLLFRHSFTINKALNDYTYIETAVIRNAVSVIDFLLQFKPDVTTIHPTPDDGETNAIQLAEKYKQTVALQKLNKYIASK